MFIVPMSQAWADLAKFGKSKIGGGDPAALGFHRCLDRGDVDLLHSHHRLERALGGRLILTGRRFQECTRGDLPGQAPSVLAPPARAFGSSVADDRIPVTIGLGLVLGADLEREGFAVFESGAAVQSETGYPQHRELDRQHLSLLASRVIAGRAMDSGDGAVWEGPGVKPRGIFCRAVVPKANHVLSHRLVAPHSSVGAPTPSMTKECHGNRRRT